MVAAVSKRAAGVGLHRVKASPAAGKDALHLPRPNPDNPWEPTVARGGAAHPPPAPPPVVQAIGPPLLRPVAVRRPVGVVGMEVEVEVEARLGVPWPLHPLLLHLLLLHRHRRRLPSPVRPLRPLHPLHPPAAAADEVQ